MGDIKANFADRPPSEFEIIVVDNGSSDSTAQICVDAGCTVLVEPDLSISELRNTGARTSSGSIIVFIDSDVSLTPDWRSDIQTLLPSLSDGSKRVAGSHYRPYPDTPRPLRYWFVASYENPRLSFLPGGHTIVARDVFEEIGGFSAEFSTSEDIEFCHRATKLGFSIDHHPELGVVHRGDPQTIRAFLKRECWHGGSDFESLPRMFTSLTALATWTFLLAHVFLAIGLIQGSPGIFASAIAALTSMLFFTSHYLFPKSTLRTRLLNSMNAYLYYLGRVCALRALFVKSVRS